MKLRATWSLLVLCCFPTVAFSNDGFGGLTSTGLQLSKSRNVRMVDEDLYISPKEIRVAYVFENTGPTDEEGEVIFPLPPIAVSFLQESPFALSESELSRENVVNFTAVVDGAAVAVNSERRAVIEPEYTESRALKAVYETPGRDVTAKLHAARIPLTLNLKKITSAVTALPKSMQTQLQADKLVTIDMTPGSESVTPAWSIIQQYHWTQKFPAGRKVVIRHAYNPAPPGGIFVWPENIQAPENAYLNETIQKYCIDASTQRALSKMMAPNRGTVHPTAGIAWNLDYVLTTANTWSQPIGHFHLTLDKAAPSNILSLCIQGLRKTGPTTFELERTNFQPTRDLQLLIVSRSL